MLACSTCGLCVNGVQDQCPDRHKLLGHSRLNLSSDKVHTMWGGQHVDLSGIADVVGFGATGVAVSGPACMALLGYLGSTSTVSLWMHTC